VSESATFPASPASPRAARRFVRAVLPAAPDAEFTDTVLLLVTELVTNAIVHARSPVRVSVAVDDSRLRVAVYDYAPQPPIRRPPSEEALNGRGLLLVERLSDRWGFDAGPSGKSVWFEIGTEPAAGHL
jgi:anti-sigma regulatory factor (Ser/Thr protein kinase)